MGPGGAAEVVDAAGEEGAVEGGLQRVYGEQTSTWLAYCSFRGELKESTKLLQAVFDQLSAGCRHLDSAHRAFDAGTRTRPHARTPRFSRIAGG